MLPKVLVRGGCVIAITNWERAGFYLELMKPLRGQDGRVGYYNDLFNFSLASIIPSTRLISSLVVSPHAEYCGLLPEGFSDGTARSGIHVDWETDFVTRIFRSLS
jgi:hypothetical protein